MALSTFRPVSSPRLSSIRLGFTGSLITELPIEPLIKDTGNDLRQVADEVARIEREFEGAVDFAVVKDSEFEVVLDTLGVRFRFVALTKHRGRADPFSLIPCRYFSITFIETRSTVLLSIGHSVVLNCPALYDVDRLAWTPTSVLSPSISEQETRESAERKAKEMEGKPLCPQSHQPGPVLRSESRSLRRSRRTSRRSQKSAYPYKLNTWFSSDTRAEWLI